ncbi:hypothetical protein ABIC28_000589 [Rhodococcus sp. PvR044]|jgi:hypothetical protein|uniref:DUF6912 family protein n=1 Tax=Rhodococcus TaxID=1827 RepID=UPI000BDB4AF1|nr:MULTISPECIES: hypothetical protein [Rhodococcus]MBP1163061.1 hypothetical protein [Rhodococcus sp. PvR099]MCZ4554603.1 hypothetical protein [Rhodococcus maanshanensis]PTR44424.1 hypothetical protein C8K38_104260 [Rhodococcus sp. OK611]SNX89865.1 hypothetical protein SAMN05447004_103259 [Rhodococcus sp. OK270]
MRVYIPATIAMLQRLVADQEFDPVSRTAFAVTPALREAYASGDDDELAEVAMTEAARASLRLLAAEDDDEGVASNQRRAVIAADVDEVKLRPDLDDAVVRLAAPVTLAEVASVHVDLAEAEPAIAKAVEAIDAADLGDADAEFVLGDAEDHELAWYATQELAFLLDLL